MFLTDGAFKRQCGRRGPPLYSCLRAFISIASKSALVDIIHLVMA
jgi:hypothetical protein